MDDEEMPGGESVCYANFFCDGCDVLLDGREHLASCSQNLMRESNSPSD